MRKYYSIYPAIILATDIIFLAGRIRKCYAILIVGRFKFISPHRAIHTSQQFLYHPLLLGGKYKVSYGNQICRLGTAMILRIAVFLAN